MLPRPLRARGYADGATSSPRAPRGGSRRFGPGPSPATAGAVLEPDRSSTSPARRDRSLPRPSPDLACGSSPVLEACPLQFMISLTCMVAYLPCGDRLRSAGALENAFALVRAAPYPFEPQLSRTVARRTPFRNIKRGADRTGGRLRCLSG